MRILKNRRKTMDLGFDVVVTITGIVLVFLILITVESGSRKLP